MDITHSCLPGDWPEDFGGENGNYQNVCLRCDASFMGHKRRLVCKVCSLAYGDVPPHPDRMGGSK